MRDPTDIIRDAKSTYFVNYTFDVANTTNETTGFTIRFPAPALNIKANNAFVSIEKLAYLNYAADIGDDVPVVCVQTGIPSTSCIDASQNPISPGITTFFENICWDQHFDDSAKAFREAYMYRDDTDSKTLCANPMGNSYNLKFFQFGADGSRVITDFQGGNNVNVNTVVMTLKVQLIEEEIL